MASIPCAAYQASHIHAQLRKQSYRSRHSSGASVSSQDQDGSESGSPSVIHDASRSVFLPNMKTKVISVSEWLGLGWKKINANVHLQDAELKAAGVTGSVSDASVTGSITSAASSTTASAMVKS